MSKVASGMATAAGVAAGGAGVVAGPGAGAAGVRAEERAACAGPASVIKVRITVPSLTRSPTLTFRSATFPPSGEGTSIEALSDSSVTSGCSAAMVSPGLTMTSMIGTSLKSPMSGTRTSATPAGALVGAGGADTAGFTGSSAGASAPPQASQISFHLPVLVATLEAILCSTTGCG